MQILRVDTRAGTAIWAAPSRMACLYLLAHLKIAIDVFDFHGGIVDQNADRESEAPESHDVDGFAERAEREKGAEDRQRN